MVEGEITLAGDLTTKEWVNRWPYVRLDLFKNIDKMTVDTLDMFNDMVGWANQNNNWMHHVNSDHRQGNAGQHPLGRAIDCYFYEKQPGDVNVADQFFWAMRFNWGGIGFYPHWNTPGIHVDMRQNIQYRSLWWRDSQDQYQGVQTYFF